MPSLSVLVDLQRVNDYLSEHGLEEGYVELEHVLLQAEGMQSGAAAVLLVATIDGKKRLIKTSFNLFDMARGALLGALQRLANGGKEGN